MAVKWNAPRRGEAVPESLSSSGDPEVIRQPPEFQTRSVYPRPTGRFVGRWPARDAAPVVPPETTAKLAKILGMLGSRHDGEVPAAARLAQGLVHAANLTWHDVIVGDAPAVDGLIEVFDLQMAEACTAVAEIYDARSVNFLATILPRLRRGHAISERQRNWLGSLFETATIAGRGRRA